MTLPFIYKVSLADHFSILTLFRMNALPPMPVLIHLTPTNVLFNPPPLPPPPRKTFLGIDPQEL